MSELGNLQRHFRAKDTGVDRPTPLSEDVEDEIDAAVNAELLEARASVTLPRPQQGTVEIQTLGADADAAIAMATTGGRSSGVGASSPGGLLSPASLGAGRGRGLSWSGSRSAGSRSRSGSEDGDGDRPLLNRGDDARSRGAGRRPTRDGWQPGPERITTDWKAMNTADAVLELRSMVDTLVAHSNAQAMEIEGLRSRLTAETNRGRWRDNAGEETPLVGGGGAAAGSSGCCQGCVIL